MTNRLTLRDVIDTFDLYQLHKEELLFRGGSRTSPRRGRQYPGGRLPNILVIFSEKPYEIKEFLVRRGGPCRVRPNPKSATVVAVKIICSECLLSFNVVLKHPQPSKFNFQLDLV